MSVIELGLLIGIIMCFFLPDDQQIANEGWFYRLKSKKNYGILWLPQKICDIKYKEGIDSKFVRKIDGKYFNMKYDKKHIIVVLYKIKHFGHF